MVGAGWEAEIAAERGGGGLKTWKMIQVPRKCPPPAPGPPELRARARGDSNIAKSQVTLGQVPAYAAPRPAALLPLLPLLLLLGAAAGSTAGRRRALELEWAPVQSPCPPLAPPGRREGCCGAAGDSDDAELAPLGEVLAALNLTEFSRMAAGAVDGLEAAGPYLRAPEEFNGSNPVQVCMELIRGDAPVSDLHFVVLAPVSEAFQEVSPRRGAARRARGLTLRTMLHKQALQQIGLRR